MAHIPKNLSKKSYTLKSAGHSFKPSISDVMNSLAYSQGNLESNTKHLIFKNPTPIDFAIGREVFKERLVNKGVKDMVMIERERAADGSWIPVQEITFDLPRPSLQTSVTAKIAARTTLIGQINTIALQAAATLPVENGARARATFEADEKMQTNLLNLEKAQDALNSSFQSDLRNWEFEKEKYEKKIQAISEIFSISIDRTTMKPIRQLLDQKRFANAWWALCDLYSMDDMGVSARNLLVTTLRATIFNQGSMSDLIDVIETVADKLNEGTTDGQGHFGDADKLGVLISAVKKSPEAEEYLSIIDYHENKKSSYAEFKLELLSRYTALHQVSQLSPYADNQQGVSGMLNTLRTEEDNPAPTKRQKAGRGGGGRGAGRGGGRNGGRGGANAGRGSYSPFALDLFRGRNCSYCGKGNHIDRFCRLYQRDVANRDARAEEYAFRDAVKLSGSAQPATAAAPFRNMFNKSSTYSIICLDEPTIVLICELTTNDCSDAQAPSPAHFAGVMRSTGGCDRYATSRLPESGPLELEAVIQEVLLTAVLYTSSILFAVIIIDSGATRHMFCDKNLFVRLHSTRGRVALGATGNYLEIAGIGDTCLDVIRDVLYVPALNVNVLSVSQFEDMGLVSTFCDGRFSLYDPMTDTYLLHGTRVGNLYHLHDLFLSGLHGSKSLEEYAQSTRVDIDTVNTQDGLLQVQGQYRDPPSAGMSTPTRCDTGTHMSVADDEPSAEQGVTPASAADDDTTAANPPVSAQNILDALHIRWGHASEGKIKRAIRDGIITCKGITYHSIKDLTLGLCVACQKGRSRARAAGEVTDHTWPTLSKIAIDYKGPFPVKSPRKNTGFFLISDYASNFMMAYAVKQKSEIIDCLEKFMISYVLLYSHNVSVLQCDAEMVNVSTKVRDWAAMRSVKLSISPPYEHNRNGQIERDMQTVMDKARTLMASRDVPSTYWEYAIDTACYCINRLPTAHRDITPIEAVTGKKPDLTNMVSFYAPGVYHLTKEERKGKSWNYKAAECRMLGYSDDSEGAYRILSMANSAVLVRANCKFTDEYTEEDLIDTDYEDPAEDSPQGEPVMWDGELKDEPDAIIPISWDEIARMDKNSESDEEEHTTEADDDESVLNLIDLRTRWMNDVVCAVKALVLPKDPATISEALEGPDSDKWTEAIAKELEAFSSRSTWGPAEQHGRGMKTKLVLKHQFDNEYNIKYKARLVVCGYSQVWGLDYTDTYSPTTSTPIVLFLIHLSASRGWKMSAFDVSAAYLEGRADTQMFAWLPAELMSTGKRHRVEILGNWYGEKQAGRIWHIKFDAILTSMNFVQCPMMPCFYMWTNGTDTIFLCIHVDDGLLISNNPALYAEFLSTLLTHIQKAVLFDDPRKYLGMELERQPDGRIKVHHTKYIEEQFGEFTQRAPTPMSTAVNLRTELPNPSNESLLPDTGKFRFIADRARPDILAAVGAVSTGGDKSPSDAHVSTSKRIKSYLTLNKELGIILGGSDPVCLFGYADANYVTDGDAKCRIGGCLFLNQTSGAIESFSKNDTFKSTLSHSSTEAEIKAIDELVRRIEYWLEVLQFSGIEVTEPVKVFVDNKSAIELCRVLKSTHAVKHINMRIKYIHEMISSGKIGLYFVPSELNVADLLTKALSILSTLRHRGIMLNGHDGDVWAMINAQAVNFLDVSWE